MRSYARNHLRYPSVILASELFLIIFIGLCGPVELFLVHSNVTHLVGLSVDCEANTNVLSRELILGMVALQIPIQKNHYMCEM